MTSRQTIAAKQRTPKQHIPVGLASSQYCKMIQLKDAGEKVRFTVRKDFTVSCALVAVLREQFHHTGREVEQEFHEGDVFYAVHSGCEDWYYLVLWSVRVNGWACSCPYRTKGCNHSRAINASLVARMVRAARAKQELEAQSAQAQPLAPSTVLTTEQVATVEAMSGDWGVSLPSTLLADKIREGIDTLREQAEAYTATTVEEVPSCAA